MKSEKSDNNRENRNNPINPETQTETRGRKPLPNPSTQISWRIPHDVYQLLVKERARLEKDTGLDVPLSNVFNMLVKLYLK